MPPTSACDPTLMPLTSPCPHPPTPPTPTPKSPKPLTYSNLETYQFMFLNIQRLLVSTKPKIKMLYDLCTLNTLFICLAETWLHEGILDAEVYIPGFTIIRSDRQREGGGICLYVKNSASFEVCANYSGDSCSLLIVKLTNPSVIIISIYRPPHTNNFSEYFDIIDRVNCYVDSLPTPTPQVIILGDFNFPEFKWDLPNYECRAVAPLLHLSDHLFITQQIKKPTRLNSVLDLVFMSDELISSYEVYDTIISDHRLITVETSLPISHTYTVPPAIRSKNSFEALDFNKANWDNLRKSLSETDWNTISTNHSTTDQFKSVLTLIADKCVTHVPRKREKSKKNSKYKRQRRVLMRKRAKLKKASPPPVNLSNKLIDIEQKISDSHSAEKNSEEALAIAKIKSDPNYFFKYAKKHSVCKTEIGPLLNKQSQSLTNEKSDMCKLLIEHFNSVFTTPTPSKIIYDPVAFFAKPTYVPVDQTLSDITITPAIVTEAIKELKLHSAAGPDGVPSSLLKECSRELSPVLVKLFRSSISSGEIPQLFKEAAIVPIFKSGDKTLASNYRPISLTSILIKVLERIVRKQVFNFLSSMGKLNDSQHGFRNGRSCLSALLNVFDDIMHLVSKDCAVDMIYLDFAKAFDKVDHGILLHKLRSSGIYGNLGVWFYNFLCNRTHHVRIPGGVSLPHPVISGVPQGTVLGPLLFLIMISDINSDIKHSCVTSFADDTKVYSCISNVNHCKELQSDLDLIYRWADTNNMFFNAQKFHFISFSSPPTLINDHPSYLDPSNNIISPSSTVLDLGVYISSDCTFEAHINNIVKRCTQLSGWVMRTFKSRDNVTMLTLFKSLILSRLDYCSQLWSPHLVKHVNLIEKVQRNFTKHIRGMHELPYHERLSALKLYSLQRRRERYSIIYIWKIIEGLAPNFTNPIIFKNSDRRGRSCIVSHVSSGRTGTIAYNSFRWRAIRLFNCLPKHIRNLTCCTILSFKTQLDAYLKHVPDLPCTPGYNNSLDRGDCVALTWRARSDGLDTN